MDIFKDYMQDVDCVALLLLCGPIFAVVICGILVITKLRNNTMRLNSKGSPSSSFKSYNCKGDTLDTLSIRSTNNRGNTSNTSKKQRKRHNSKNDSTMLRAKNNQEHFNSSGLTIRNWLQSDVYCYEKKSTVSSCFEGNMTSCHAMKHRNNESTKPGRSENLNSCSSNEDLASTTHLEKIGQSKQETILKQKRLQKRKHYPTFLNNTNVQRLEVGAKSKEFVKPSGTKQMPSTSLSLRKQCTRAAALNSNKMSRTFNHNGSNLPVRSSLSAASSTTSIYSSISSSTSNSPIHSVNSSPTASPTASKRNKEYVKKRYPPLRQFAKLKMNEQELVKQMRRYIIDPNLLTVYGFPVESVHHKGCVEIFKCLPKHLAEEAVTKDNQRHHRHFYGRKKCDVMNGFDGLNSSSWGKKSHDCSQADSGHGSGESSPHSTDSDSSEMSEEYLDAPLMAFYTPDGVYQIFSGYCNTAEKQCVRCSKMFKVNEKGEYLSSDSCTYHWGRLNNVCDGKLYMNIYSCCQGDVFSEGCSKHPLHVWNGVVVGKNGPYSGFLHTQHKRSSHHKPQKIFAIDCEMSYTGLGLEVTKVTVIGFDGSLVYEHFVNPQSKIIDYNTRFSGVSEKDFLPNTKRAAKTFEEVQKDLLNLFDADTILIGHGLDNDLKVLRLVHKTIVDTSVIFKHSTGYPYRRSLKNLTKSFLERDIQSGNMGHSSFEDSRACLELMMWKIRNDLRH